MVNPRIFINYRTTDTRDVAGALHRDLEGKLGESCVFIDYDGIPGGIPWPQQLRDEADAATHMVCLIGKHWLEARDEKSQKRMLENPDDWVRCEILRALTRKITVLPVLVEDALIPEAGDLPPPLRPLLNLQARRLRRADWENDVQQILEDLGCELPRSRPRSSWSSRLPGTRKRLIPAFQTDLRHYLRDLISKMGKRNTTSADSYVELAAEERAEPGRLLNQDDQDNSTLPDYLPGLGHLLQQPEIHPALAEVAENAGRFEGMKGGADLLGVPTRTVRNVMKVLRSREDPLVILGEPGSGKSTVMRKLAIELAQRAFIGGAIPIYIELGKFRPLGERNPTEAIMELVCDAVPLGVQTLRQHLGPGGISTSVVLLFDGMDEMPRSSDYSKRVAALASFAADTAPFVRSVFACRTNDFDQGFGHQQLVLKPFDEPRIRLFLRRVLGKEFIVAGEPETPRSAVRRILKDEELGAEAGNPLTLSLAAHFLKKNRDWPRGRADLFNDHIAAMADHAIRRTMGRPPEDDELKKVFDAWAGIAYEIFQRDGAVFIEQQLLEEAVSKRDVHLGLAGGLILKESDAGLLKFRHHRLQEFLVACRLRLPNPPQPEWEKILVSPRWQETLLNYFSLGGRDEQALKIVFDQIRPANEHFQRLHLFAADSAKIVAKAKEDYEAIKPDTERYVSGPGGSGGMVPAYSAKQQKRKDDAQKTLEAERLRHRRETSVPPDLEMSWSEHLLFAARVAAVLRPSAGQKTALAEALRETVTGLLDFGRPAAQVRTLAAWREIPDWFSVSVLAPARDSKLGWVRAQAIYTLVSAPLHRERVDETFVEELEWELLNFRLLKQWAVFRQTSATHPSRRSLLSLAFFVHATFFTIIHAAVFVAGALAVGAAVHVPTFANFPELLLWALWIALVGLVVVLTIPAFTWPLLARIAAANSLVSVPALTTLLYLERAATAAPEGWSHHPWIFTCALGPGFLGSGALVLTAFATHLLLRKVHGRGLAGTERNVFSTDAFRCGLKIMKIMRWPIGIAFLLVLILSPLGKVFGVGAISLVLLAAVGGLLYGFGRLIKARWNEHRALRPLARIHTLIKEAFFACGVIALVVGLLYLIAALFKLLGPALKFIERFFPTRLGDWLSTAFGGFVAIIAGVVVLVAIIVYIYTAFRRVLDELRYFFIRRRPKIFQGSLADWEVEFRAASGYRRRELLQILDYRASGVAPEAVLEVLHKLELTFDLDSVEAEAFHKTIYNLREAVRQQRWSQASTSPAVQSNGGDSKNL